MFDGEAFGQQMVEIVRGYVAAEIESLRAENKALLDANAALTARVVQLEERELLLPEKGEPGEPGQPGASVDMEAVAAMVAEAAAALPPAEKGEPGADADMEEIAARIEASVKSALEALPVPKDGEPGQDGLGLANALIDRDGALVVTFTDGSTKNLGPVVGKDGENGKDGHTFTLDDFDIVPLDERTVQMGFTHGGVKHSFELAIPAVIYRGVWREGETYQRGDVATWGGSMWHCDKDDCTAKPDGGEWTLSVKKGRDGKDAK